MKIEATDQGPDPINTRAVFARPAAGGPLLVAFVPANPSPDDWSEARELLRRADPSGAASPERR